MSRVIITPKLLKGSVTPPPSKSQAHRAVICAALANGVSRIFPFKMSNDMKATIGAVQALGARTLLSSDILSVDGTNTLSNNSAKIDCLESGSTLRFLIPVAAAKGINTVFSGRGRLPKRPIGPYIDCFPEKGVRCETGGGLPLKISGKLQNGTFSLPGNISSQFITGLLLALPMLGGNSTVKLETPLESADYVNLTCEVMERFGVFTEKKNGEYFVKGSQNYTPCDFGVEADWSQAAFWIAANALGADIECKSMNPDSSQGDKAMIDVVKILRGKNSVREIDASQIPDLVPPIAAAACALPGKTIISGAQRLRIKESDRLRCLSENLGRIGADISEKSDGLIITGKDNLRGGSAQGCGDHRIVMALSIAAVKCTGKVTINGCEVVDKSYPGFFEDYNSLGGCADVVSDR